MDRNGCCGSGSTESFSALTRRRLLKGGVVAGTGLAIGGRVWGAAPALSAVDDGPILDPLPDPTPSNLALTLEEFASFPQSFPIAATDVRITSRFNRINHLGEIPDGSGRLFVPDLNGPLYVRTLDDCEDPGSWKPYLDMRTLLPDFVSADGLGSGFRYVAFHPEFASNGLFYTSHTENPGSGRTPDWNVSRPNKIGVLTEWKADDPSASKFRGTQREMLRVGFYDRIHGIQMVDFHPYAKPGDDDYGLLYVAVGDGGAGALVDNTPQNMMIPQGTLLRIDPLGRDSGNGRYGIPQSNPFVGKSGYLGEIYAYGFRDPHRFSWDPQPPHRMFMAHMGEHAIESIVEIQAGDNFGWPFREGPFVFKPRWQPGGDACHVFPLPEDDASFGYTYPVAAYDHAPPAGWPCGTDVGHAVIGGYMYRGTLPALRGKFLFADNVTGRIFFSNEGEMRHGGPLATVYQPKLLDASGNAVTMVDLGGGQTRVDVVFGRNVAGEVYVLAKANGKVFKIVGADLT